MKKKIISTAIMYEQNKKIDLSAAPERAKSQYTAHSNSLKYIV